MKGNKYDMENGLTAIETLLGWVAVGKNPDARMRVSKDTVQKSHEMFAQTANDSDLWRLDIIGIEDPIRQTSKEERDSEVKKLFKETTIVNSEGRYEVMLPWIIDHAPFSSNKNLAFQHLNGTLKKLGKLDLMKEYDEVFTNGKRMAS